jgi:trk system potassium uptake protein TrkA
MKYAVIGLGDFGRNAAKGLTRRGAEVIAVDINMEPVNCVKDEVTLAVKMDGSQEGAMAMHGIGEVDVLIAAIGENFEAQVLTVVHASQAGIKKVIARAKTPDHIRVLKAVGAHEAFNPEETAARWMVQRLLIANISNYFELAEGFSVVEVEAPAGIVGKTLEELNLRKKFRINLVAIRRMVASRESGELISKFNPVPDPTHMIEEKDVLTFAGSVLDLANFMGQFE